MRDPEQPHGKGKHVSNAYELGALYQRIPKSVLAAIAVSKCILWLVDRGDVRPARHDTPWDGEETLLVAATSAEAALEVAAAYDRGERGVDTLIIDGKPVACVYQYGAGGRIL